jgi:hypothetical protein
LGGEFSQGPAITSWGVDQLDIFAPWSDETISHNSWNGTAWTGWAQQQPPATTNYKPTAVDYAPNHIDLFVTLAENTDGTGNVYQQTCDSGACGAWRELTPGVLTSGPAATSWGPGRLDVFGRGTDGLLYHNWSVDGVNWNFWEAPLGIAIKNAPAAVGWGAGSAGSNQLTVFYLGPDDDQLHWLRYDENIAQVNPDAAWQDLGIVGGNKGSFNSAPAVTSWNPNEFDVFGRWTDGTLRHSTFNGSSWSNWDQMTTFKLGNAPGAVAWANGRIDVAITDDNGGMHHSWLQNGVWNPVP